MTTRSDRLTTVNTIATKVYLQLKDDILNGDIPPGTHLVKRALAQRYGVSVPPIAEACLRLENDGLVENSPLQGSFVISVSPEKIHDEMLYREAIECQIARVFSRQASERAKSHLMELADAVDEIHERLQAGEHGSEKLYLARHTEFHMRLAKLSGSDVLYQHLKRLWGRMLVQIWNVDFTVFPSPKGWHATLAEKLCSGSELEAEEAMREHIYINWDKKISSDLPDMYRKKHNIFDEIELMRNEEDGDADLLD